MHCREFLKHGSVGKERILGAQALPPEELEGLDGKQTFHQLPTASQVSVASAQGGEDFTFQIPLGSGT